MTNTIYLKPDHKLLNPNFDGYKLSSDADVTVYSKTLNKDGVERKISYSNSYLHTRLEALHNHFFGDPFHPMSVYYFSSRGHLVKCNYSELQDSRLSVGEVVWQTDLNKNREEDSEENEGSSGHYHASVHFPSSEMAVVNNGQGSLHILETGDRKVTQSWLLSFECSTEKGVIAHTCLKSGNDHKRYLHCLFVAVTTPHSLINNPEYVVGEKLASLPKDSALHLIHWLTIVYNGTTWEIHRIRSVAGEGTIEYCSLDEKAEGLLILCHKKYSFVADSSQPLKIPELHAEEKVSRFAYVENDVHVAVTMNIGSTSKEDLNVKITPQELSIHIQENLILEGQLKHPVDANLAMWTLVDGKLELTLPKVSEGVMWEGLFEEEILDQNMVEEVNKRLEHLTSDKWNPCPNPEKSVYNAGQLEACDEASEDLLLMRLDGSTHELSNLGQLGPVQHLFNCQIHEAAPPAFCLRHDVDGILWQPVGMDTFTHIATYNAFGYVKASKTMAKFTCASADVSYVAVADVRSHIYVFFQSEVFGGELRNRRSGKISNTVARQLVFSMKTHSEILGLHASPSVLFVLTDQAVYAYCICNL